MKDGRTIIAPKYQHSSIVESLLAETDVVTGIALKPMTSLLSPDDNQDYFRCAALLIQLKNEISILKPYLSHPLFIEEILKFHEYFSCFEVNLEMLPESNTTESELKQIFRHLAALETIRIKQYREIAALDINENLWLSEYFSVDILEIKMKEKLLQKNISCYKLPYQHPEKITAYKASNQRLEVEGIIQQLILQDLDLNKTLLVYADASYEAILRQLLHRYQLPHHFFQNTQKSEVVLKFEKLIEFAENFNSETLLSILENNCLNLNNNTDFHEYARYFSLSPQDILDEIQVYNPDDYKDFNLANQLVLRNTVAAALEEQAEVKGFLQELLLLRQNNNFSDTCNFLYSFLASQSRNPVYLKECYQLADCLETYLPQMTDWENPLPHLLHFLGRISVLEATTEGGLLVADLHSFFISGRENIILIGCSSNYYPAVPVFQGIIDENYLLHCENFCSEEERYTLYMQQLNRIFTLSRNLYLSYSYGDYNGKVKEIAFEIEDWLQENKISIREMPIKENDPRPHYKESIESEISQNLFFTETQLYGSVSAFELFFNCPYAYYLKYGLNLYNEDYPQLDAAYFGTLLHGVLEVLLQRHGKNYAAVDREEIKSETEQIFSRIKALFTGEIHKYQLTVDKIVTLLHQSFMFLQDMEEHTAFIPCKSEAEFNYTIDVGELSVKLKGYIDRVDETETHFRIIDLKSSQHELSAPQVLAGLRLQLLSYTWVYQQLHHKEAMGCYYFSFTSPTISINARKISLRPLENHYLNAEDYRSEVKKNRQLSGWTFADPTDLDDSGTHIKGVNLNASGQISVHGGEYDFAKVETFIYEIYNYLAKELWQGNINLTPVVGACTYCDYRSICQFDGFQQEPFSKSTVESFRKDKA